MSPSSTAVHGVQHDTKRVTFELLSKCGVICLEPARVTITYKYTPELVMELRNFGDVLAHKPQALKDAPPHTAQKFLHMYFLRTQDAH